MSTNDDGFSQISIHFECYEIGDFGKVDKEIINDELYTTENEFLFKNFIKWTP